ncbi:hypothetical protein PIB30_044081 [Stylosanthes scabra]|uniref:Vacuolar protein sorting-associated protein 8 central domain-containing protein n=1 Tax=Stylosanthes scabra TaxID=79078 RepID=A0ABU6XH66_9FABA|nr:hypothetical protein [Stylosanthes scabra]
MELDIHTFLPSDEEDDTADHHRRTVDDILNDCSSSSSSPSPPSSPSTSSTSSKPFHPLQNSQTTPPIPQSHPNQYNSARPASFSRVKPHDPFSNRVSRPPPFSSLLGGVRSNAKPGAALAAAAAASRSIPTPHAAAIKSRRSLQKLAALGSGELSSSISGIGDDSDVSSRSELGEGTSERFEGFDSGVVEKFDELERKVEIFRDHSESSGGVGVVDSEVDDGANIGVENDSEKRDLDEVDNGYDDSEKNVDSSTPFDDDNDKEDEKIMDTSTITNVVVDDDLHVGEKEITEDGLKSENIMEREEVVNDGAFMEESKSEVNVIVGDGDGDDGGSLGSDDVSELVEERLEELENKRAAKRAEKKLESLKKPLELAEELEKKHASTGMHLEEGAAAQPMRLEGVRRGSTTLGYFDVDADNAVTRAISSHAFRREHGSAQVLAAHANYIAVGMAKGLIVVVPSKYSIHHADSVDGKMLMLGMQGDRTHAPVTSMSFNQQGDLLLAGYGDGHVTIWDVQKGVVAKVISGEHTSPVVHAFFLGQDPQNTRQFKAITGDCKGLVLLHSISVVPLLNRFTIKTQCLLDGQKTGLVLSASPLLPDEYSGGVVVFVTHQTALVVRLSPTLQVYAQLSRPDGIREGSMPYTAWKYMAQTCSSAENTSTDAVERVSLLAIAWERKVQVAKLIKSELKVYGKWSLDSAAIGLAWLDDQMLVVLTSTGQLYLCAKDGTVIHQTSFGVDSIGGDDLISYHTHFFNIFGNPEKDYHNSVAVRGASIYILGPTHLVVSRLLPWKERILVLRKAGDWMGALNMAMTLFDGHAHGVVDLPRTLDAVHEAIMPFLLELLTSYVDEVFSYISVAFCNQIGKLDESGDSSGRSNSVHSEIKEQYTRVGGVAVEFCCHVKRTDILFDKIFAKFVDVNVQQRETFLELLEPYILKDMLGSLPPERVEQCVLHMDISSLDFNQVVRLCREHGLYSALVYLFNKGLNDYRAPLEELFEVLQNSQKDSAAALGYRMLVYLKYCFTGLAFPPGRGTIPPTRLQSLRKELVEFLLEDSNASKSKAKSNLVAKQPCLNVYLLLELDTEATLDVLRCAFVEDEISIAGSSSLNSVNQSIEDANEENGVTEPQSTLVQNTVDALVKLIDMKNVLLDTTSSGDYDGLIKEWPLKDMGYLFEFIAYYVALQKAKISKDVLCQIFEYLTSERYFATNVLVHGSTPKNREKQVLALLEVLPDSDWDASHVLELCERAQYHQVCGFIHSIRHEYVASLDSYMKDVDEPIHAFSFINVMLSRLTNKNHATIRSAVISRIPELVELSREGTFHMVISHFSDENSRIITELHSHPRSLFLYLKTLIELHLFGTLDLSNLRKGNLSNEKLGKDDSQGLSEYIENISNFPKYIRENPIHVPDDLIELYLELLCQYEGGSVLKFLEKFDSYHVEHCLRLCQQYGIIDAAAFLLERVGDVGSALVLTLSDLNDKFVEVDAVVEGLVSKRSLRGSSHTEVFNAVLRMKEVCIPVSGIFKDATVFDGYAYIFVGLSNVTCFMVVNPTGK